jgi:outer membrane protein assembly factor BamB
MDLQKKPRLLGKKRIAVLAAGIAFLCLMPFAYWGVGEIDHQFANFTAVGFTLLGGLLVACAVLTWVSWKWSVGLVVLLAVGVFSATQVLEFKGFTGELRPVFVLKGRGTSTKTVLRPDASTDDANPEWLAQLSRSSSSQLLGNDRNGRIDSPEFSTRWEESPPKMLWKRPIGLGWSGTVVRDGKIYTLYQSDRDETIAALDLVSGATLWETKIPGYHSHPLGGTGPRATPTLFGDYLISQTASGHLVVCKSDSGIIVWRKDLIALGGWTLAESEKAITWGRSGSPLIVDRNGIPSIVIPLGGSKNHSEPISLAAFDLAGGDLLWRAGRDQISYSSPVELEIEGQRQIVTIQEDFVVSYSIDDGREYWRAPWPSKSDADACASQPVLVGKNRILLGKGYAQGSKLIEISVSGDDTSENRSWSVRTIWDYTSLLKTKFTSAIHFQGKLFGLSDGVLECVNPDTGKRVWKKGRYGQGHALVVNDRLLVSTEDGRVVLVEPETGEAPYELQVIQGITWNIPTVAGPFLIVRNGEEIACLYSPLEHPESLKHSSQLNHAGQSGESQQLSAVEEE